MQNYTFAGVFWLEVEGFVAERVRSVDNGSFGIRAVRSERGRISNSYAAGSARAGISIADCDVCDTIVELSTAERSLAGFVGSNAGALVVRASEFHDSAGGIVLRTTDPRARQRGSHIYGNLIRNNANPVAPAAPISESLDLASPRGPGSGSPAGGTTAWRETPSRDTPTVW